MHFVGRKTESEKMRNSRGHQGKNEPQGKKNKQEHIRHFLYKTCN